jgi:hypothetical protein
MNRILGLACAATAVIIAALDLVRRPVEPDQRCVFCGKAVRAPLYRCNHYLGNGLEPGSAPAWLSPKKVWRAKVHES